jgi:hypothetical protein
MTAMYRPSKPVRIYVRLILLIAALLETPKLLVMIGSSEPYHQMGYLQGRAVSDSPRWWLIPHLAVSLLLLECTGMLLLSSQDGSPCFSRWYRWTDRLSLTFIVLMMFNTTNLRGRPPIVAFAINIGVTLLLAWLWSNAARNRRYVWFFFCALSVTPLLTLSAVTRHALSSLGWQTYL